MFIYSTLRVHYFFITAVHTAYEVSDRGQIHFEAPMRQIKQVSFSKRIFRF